MKTQDPNPWSEKVPPHYGVKEFVTVDERERLSRIAESTNIPWLLQVAAWRDSQASVRLAAQRRLRKLSKQR